MTESKKLKMDDEYITQNDIVQRYLHNKLTPEETVEFEEYMLDKPELLERLELDTVLVKTLPDVMLAKFKVPKVSINHASDAGVKVHWWTPLFSHLTTIAVSCVLVMVLWFDTTNDTANPNISPDIVYIENFRGSESSHVLDFNIGSKEKVIVVQPNAIDIDEFRVDLKSDDLLIVLRKWPVLQKNASGDLVIKIKKADYAKGNYKIQVSNADTLAIDSIFTIEIL